MEIYKFLEKQFKIIVLEKLSKTQTNKDRQINKFRKIIHEQIEKFKSKTKNHKQELKRNSGAEK